MDQVIHYVETRLGDYDIHGFYHSHAGRFLVTGISIKGRLMIPTPLFWMSLAQSLATDGQLTDNSDPRRLLRMLIASDPDAVLGCYVERDAHNRHWLVGVDSLRMSACRIQPRVRRWHGKKRAVDSATSDSADPGAISIWADAGRDTR